jgi:hypothetical protein
MGAGTKKGNQYGGNTNKQQEIRLKKEKKGQVRSNEAKQ